MQFHTHTHTHTDGYACSSSRVRSKNNVCMYVYILLWCSLSPHAVHTKGATLAVKPTGHTDVQVCVYVSLARPCRHAQSLSLAGRERVLAFVLSSLRCRPVFHYALQQQQQQQLNITLNVFTNPPFENWQKLWHSALSLSLSLSLSISIFGSPSPQQQWWGRKNWA